MSCPLRRWGILSCWVWVSVYNSLAPGLRISRVVDAKKVSIASLGYKQELRRHYSTTQIFAVAFSIMGLLPSIASTLAFSIPAGPVGMVWVNAFI